MPVIDKTGDLFDSQASVLAHGVNTKGVMGAGIAASFSKRYPVMYERYKELCEEKRLRTGQVFAYPISSWQWVFNLATQRLPGPYAELHRVEEAFSSSLFIMKALDLHSIALPRIGAGIGGLNWGLVRKEIERVSSYYPDIDVEIWTYDV